jgi:hypothetical protein
LTSLPSPKDKQDANSHLPHPLTAPLTRSASFVFRNLKATKPESYLLDIRSPEYVFAPYRVDVSADGTILGVWETFRGNPWDNRGPEKFVVDAAAGNRAEVTVEAKVLARRGFYEERAGCEMNHPFPYTAVAGNALALGAPNDVMCMLTRCVVPVSPLSLFKNPMILLALVALGFTFGMPKLMENSKSFHCYWFLPKHGLLAN